MSMDGNSNTRVNTILIRNILFQTLIFTNMSELNLPHAFIFAVIKVSSWEKQQQRQLFTKQADCQEHEQGNSNIFERA